MEVMVAGVRERKEPGRRALYLCGSVCGERNDQELYPRIILPLGHLRVMRIQHVAFAELGVHEEDC